MTQRRPFKRRFSKKPFKRVPAPTMEDKIKSFVIRNSRTGFFTKLTTVSFKFEIPEEEAMSNLSSLLADNALEIIHDDNGDAKLCEAGKSYDVMQKELKRKREKKRPMRKNQRQK